MADTILFREVACITVVTHNSDHNIRGNDSISVNNPIHEIFYGFFYSLYLSFETTMFERVLNINTYLIIFLA